jgi:hypothetical protein
MGVVELGLQVWWILRRQWLHGSRPIDRRVRGTGQISAVQRRQRQERIFGRWLGRGPKAEVRRLLLGFGEEG